MKSALVLAFLLLPQSGALAHQDNLLEIKCSQPGNLQSANPPYVQTVGERLKRAGATEVTCTSCYRDPQEQLRACKAICGKESCPGLCAAPGRSQHQKVHIAVCDLKGLPAGRPGCEILKQICDAEYGGKCGIGGYKGGGFHFGVGDERFSAWTECGYLSPARNMASRTLQRLELLMQRIIGRP